MKKNLLLVFTKILFTLFIIGTIIFIFIIFSHIDIEDGIASKLGMSYFYLTLFIIIYVPFIIILNSRKLKWNEVKSRFFKFIGVFILCIALNLVLDYVFRPSKLDLLRGLPGAFGLAIGSSFIDIIFLKNKKN